MIWIIAYKDSCLLIRLIYSISGDTDTTPIGKISIRGDMENRGNTGNTDSIDERGDTVKGNMCSFSDIRSVPLDVIPNTHIAPIGVALIALFL